MIDPPWWAQLPTIPTGNTGLHFGELPPVPKSASGFTITPYRNKSIPIEAPTLPAVDLAGDLYRRLIRAIADDDRRREVELLAELTRRRR